MPDVSSRRMETGDEIMISTSYSIENGLVKMTIASDKADAKIAEINLRGWTIVRIERRHDITIVFMRAHKMGHWE